MEATQGKVCLKCQQCKPFSEFHRNRNSPDGYRQRCKACRLGEGIPYYQANHARIAQQQHGYYKRNRERILAYSRRYYAARAPEPQFTRIAREVDALTEFEIAYLAGLLDGEGSFTIAHHTRGLWVPTIDLCLTHEETIRWVSHLWHSAVFNRPVANPARHRPQFHVRCQGYRAFYLAQRMLPYMHVKNGHADLFVRFGITYEYRQTPQPLANPSIDKQRESLHYELKQLNARLVPSNGLSASTKVGNNISIKTTP